MPRFRATVWTLTAAAAAVDGDAAIERQIIEADADNKRDFEYKICDRYIYNVDNEVWFGPISEVLRLP